MSPKSRRYELAFVSFICLVIVDQLLKFCVGTSCDVTNTLQASGVVRYAENPGIAFSLPLPLMLQIIIAAVVSVWLLWEIWRSKKSSETLAFAFLLGGLVSNTYDRILRGFVVDYIALLPNLTINFADVAITLSIVALVIMTLRNSVRSV